jgi:uncharacterized membrane protein (UPF0127 family)
VRSALALATALALALVLASACRGDDGSDDPGDTIAPTVTIAVADDDGNREELSVELARTPTERSRGLTFREALPKDHGMLFVFPRDTETGFWMKDTAIPLSIAFIAGDGAILDVQDMHPLSTELHHPPGPYRYALEVNQGWFGRHDFQSGDRVEIPETAQTPEPDQMGRNLP